MKQNNEITILVVDDEDQLRKGLIRNLEMEDFKVLSARSGQEAFEIILTNPQIDFVLSDIRMPNGTGVELLEKTREKFKDLPFVLLVSGYSECTKEQAIEKGAIDLMDKPVDIDKVIAIIKSFVK